MILHPGEVRRLDELISSVTVDDDDDDEILPSVNIFRPFTDIGTIEVNFLDKIEYGDNPYLNNKLLALCSEFKDFFSTSLSPESAKLPPFSIDVPLADWEVPQRPVKEVEIKKQRDRLRKTERPNKGTVLAFSEQKIYAREDRIPQRAILCSHGLYSGRPSVSSRGIRYSSYRLPSLLWCL